MLYLSDARLFFIARGQAMYQTFADMPTPLQYSKRLVNGILKADMIEFVVPRGSARQAQEIAQEYEQQATSYPHTSIDTQLTDWTVSPTVVRYVEEASWYGPDAEALHRRVQESLEELTLEQILIIYDALSSSGQLMTIQNASLKSDASPFNTVPSLYARRSQLSDQALSSAPEDPIGLGGPLLYGFAAGRRLSAYEIQASCIPGTAIRPKLGRLSELVAGIIGERVLPTIMEHDDTNADTELVLGAIMAGYVFRD